MEKISIVKSTLEELKEAFEKAKEDTSTCSSHDCKNCQADSHNFSGVLSEQSCGHIRDILRELILREENYRQNKPQIGKCSECKSLDKSYLIRSGFRFCTHWHNFTIENGFCHAFESEENVSEPVDKSL